MVDAYWTALLAASDPALGAIVSALRAGRVDAAMFEPSPGHSSSSTLMYLTADGAWREGPTRRLRVKGNGLSFTRHTLDALLLPVAALAGGPVAALRVTAGLATLPQSTSGLSSSPSAQMPSSPPASRLSDRFRAGGPSAVVTGAARLVARRTARR